MVPKDVHAPISGTRDSVTLHGKGASLPALYGEVILGYLGGPHLITWALKSQELSPGIRDAAEAEVGELEQPTVVPAGSGHTGVCARTRKRSLGAVGGPPADSQRGNRGLNSNNCRNYIRLIICTSSGAILPQILQEGTRPCPHLVFCPVRPESDFSPGEL